jgi:hypothetical protein
MYLAQALDEFHRAGNAPDLWGVPVDDFHASDSVVFGPVQKRLNALNRRLQFLRSSVLFSAISVEAYANEYISDVLISSAVESIDPLPTPDKLMVGVQLATGDDTLLTRGAAPMQEIVKLFKTRNRLVVLR